MTADTPIPAENYRAEARRVRAEARAALRALRAARGRGRKATPPPSSDAAPEGPEVENVAETEPDRTFAPEDMSAEEAVVPDAIPPSPGGMVVSSRAASLSRLSGRQPAAEQEPGAEPEWPEAEAEVGTAPDMAGVEADTPPPAAEPEASAVDAADTGDDLPAPPDVTEVDSETASDSDAEADPESATESAEELAPEAGSETEPETAPTTTSDAEGDQAPQRSDLEQLPGAGPGLVWLFQQAGIRDLATLAAAEPAALERSLGVIGGLLDLEAWIAEAGRMAEAHDVAEDVAEEPAADVDEDAAQDAPEDVADGQKSSLS